MLFVRIIAAAFSILQPAEVPAPAPTSNTPTPLQTDEHVMLFPGVGWLDADGTWKIVVRGWVFEPESDGLVRRAAVKALAKSLGLESGEEDTDRFKARAAAFVVDNERDRRFRLIAGDPPDTGVAITSDSSPAGHFAAAISLARRAEFARVPVRVELPADDTRSLRTEVFLIPAEGLSVISDIDDTIKISDVRDRKKLLRNTFVNEFVAAPGMPEFYRRLHERGAVFHYVSASPWQLYQPLAAFAGAAGYPAGTFDMKEFRWKDRSFFSLFDDPQQYKERVITPMLERWPRRRFVLIGDSGEKDPEAYLALAKRFPDRIVRVFIRDVTNEPRECERYRVLMNGLPPELLDVFTDPSALTPPEPR